MSSVLFAFATLVAKTRLSMFITSWCRWAGLTCNKKQKNWSSHRKDRGSVASTAAAAQRLPHFLYTEDGVTWDITNGDSSTAAVKMIIGWSQNYFLWTKVTCA